MKDKYKVPVCPCCGSRDITIATLAKWDMKDQTFRTFKKMKKANTCASCEATFDEWEWKEVIRLKTILGDEAVLHFEQHGNAPAEHTVQHEFTTRAECRAYALGCNDVVGNQSYVIVSPSKEELF